MEQIKLRVNAIYDNEKYIRVLGTEKNYDSNSKTSYSATIFKTTKDGAETTAYKQGQTYNVFKGDLLLTTADTFSTYKEQKQYIVKSIQDCIVSKYR